MVTFLATFVFLLSASDSEESESDEEEADPFFGRSERVALVSELITGFFFASEDESLSESEESESESGRGVLAAKELVEEFESLSASEDESSLLEELPTASEALAFGVSSSELESELESEDDFVVFLADASDMTASELESESEASLEDELEAVLTFLVLGASSSELESDPEDDDSLLDSALRFNVLNFAFGEATFATGISFSSSASLSELLEEEDEEDFREETFLTGGASSISISLSSLFSLLLPLSLLLDSDLALAGLDFLVMNFSTVTVGSTTFA